MDKKETYSQEVVRMYADEYVPAVHRIGRFTTALAFIVSFLPVIYLILIRGFAAPVSVYVDVMIAVVAYNIGAWIINPCAHFTGGCKYLYVLFGGKCCEYENSCCNVRAIQYRFGY